MRRLGTGIWVLVVVAGSGLALARAQPVSRVPAPRDRFDGHITSATGGYFGDHGRLSIVVRTHRASGRTRHVTLTISGKRCQNAQNCLKLDGTLTGTLITVAQPGAPPDIGRLFAIAVSGKVAPLGDVSANGAVRGTGNIARGRETMTLTLKGSGWKVTLSAHSPTVRAFTAP